jgi:hypothetical protein
MGSRLVDPESANSRHFLQRPQRDLSFPVSFIGFGLSFALPQDVDLLPNGTA